MFLETNFVISDIKLCGKLRDEIGTYMHRNRGSHGLILMLKGSTHIDFIDDISINATEGQLVYLPKYSNYTTTDADQTECIFINFEIADSELTFPPFFLKKNFGDKYRPLFGKILQLWNMQRTGYMNGCFAILYDIIFNIQQDTRLGYMSYGHTHFLENVSYYIYDHILDTSLTVERIAKKFNISPEYLRKLYRTQYGVSPKEYILRKRIEMAKTMIESGEIKINCIPYECGFNDYAHFSKMFKKRVGVSPLTYLKQTRLGATEEQIC